MLLLLFDFTQQNVFIQAFGLDTPEMLEQRSIDVSTLFGNLSDVIDVSDKFLTNLKLELKGSEGEAAEQRVGKCFLDHAQEMKKVYTEYCVNNDKVSKYNIMALFMRLHIFMLLKAEQLLEKYESMPDIHRILCKGVETLQSQVACFNMGSILIKPVQRILKYPLILNELIKVRRILPN